MQECNHIIESIYTHPDLEKSISKIKDERLRDDIKQEIVVSLLEQPCDKIKAIYAADNLLRYSIRICWIMATSKNNPVYRKYKSNDKEAKEYLHCTSGVSAIPETFALKAIDALKKKTSTVYEDHETRIFSRFVELGSARKVAEYYGIPLNHTCNVIQKVKKELKCLLQS